MIVRITFAISKAAMSPSDDIRLFGRTLPSGVSCIASAPHHHRRSAGTGTPSVSIGMKDGRGVVASGAETPRISPCRAIAAVAAEFFLGHIGNGAGDGRPGAGQYADKKPITEERRGGADNTARLLSG